MARRKFNLLMFSIEHFLCSNTKRTLLVDYLLLILPQLSSAFIKIVVMLNKFSMIRAFLFCVGLTLTLWRSYDCLQKHLYNKLGTKVNMVHSYETNLPALTLCPEFLVAYNLREVFDNLK